MRSEICSKCGHDAYDHYTGDNTKKYKCWERLSQDNNDFCGCEHINYESNTKLDSSKELILTLYVVKNYEGKFFRAKGFSGCGKSWVDEIKNARIYANISPAKGCVTYFANNNFENLPIPEILELKVIEGKIIKQEDRVLKSKFKKI